MASDKATPAPERPCAGSPANIEEDVVSIGCCLIALPPELLYQIVGNLSITNHAHLAVTCRHLQAILAPELYSRDRNTGTFRTLSWAACAKKPQAVATIQRAVTYWPPGPDSLHCYFKTDMTFHGKSLKHLTPLMAAIQAGNIRVVRFLLSQGVSVHQCEDSPGHRDTLWYPIHHAIMMDHFKDGSRYYTTNKKLGIIELLLDCGANPDQLSQINPRRPYNDSTHGFLTPMHLAIMNQADHQVVELLVKKGAAATRVPYYGVPDQPYTDITPISHFVNAYKEASESHYLAVKSLIDNGGGIGSEAHMYTVTGEPLLLESLSWPRASQHSVGITELLLEHAWVTIKDTARNGDGVITHHLKAHIEWKPVKPYHKRFILRHEEHHDMVRLADTACNTIDMLLQHQANINERGSRGWTPLHAASGLHQNYSSIFDHLVVCGANVKATTSDGYTVLHTLVMSDPGADHSLVTHLLKHQKLHRYARDKQGNTFLHHLCMSRVTSFGKWMAEVAKHYERSDFKDSRQCNKAGLTPFDAATSHRDKKTIQFWIDHAFDEAEEKLEGFRARPRHQKFSKTQNKPR